MRAIRRRRQLCAAPANQNRRGNGVHIWNSVGHTIAGNVIRDTRDGIYFSFVDRSTVRDNDIARVRYGLHYMYSDENRFDRNVFSDNAAGAALMYSKGLTLAGNRFVANRSHRPTACC
jgi:nitrous oxidase accessory protein